MDAGKDGPDVIPEGWRPRRQKQEVNMEVKIKGIVKSYSIKQGGDTLAVDVTSVSDIEELRYILTEGGEVNITITSPQETLDEEKKE